jgi:class 3 adenylate cyclase
LHAEVGLAIGHATMVSEAAVPLRDAHQRGAMLAHGWAVLLSRLIGECAAAEDHDDAERWLTIAAEEAEAMGLPVEAARVELARARLLAADPEMPKDRITEQAQRATAALDAVGALPLVAAARRIGTVAGAPGPVTRTILFTDLVDSTVLNVRAGDEAFLQLVREHNEVVRGCLRRRAGVEFKHTGDGVAAWFTSPVDAVECAISINEDLDRASNLHPDYPLLVRCGLSSGEPLGNEGDLFGLSVVQAARLCAAAEAGEILVGPEIVGPARAHGIVFRRRGPMQLKGFPEPIEVSVAVMTDARTDSR